MNCAFLLVSLFSIGVCAAQTLAERLDSIAGAGVRENKSVGIVAAVVKGKDTLLLKAYGKPNVEAEAMLAADTQFAIGSATKQFTAAAILQLRDQGKLSIDDPVTKWLPEYEAQGSKVTLRHLLTHTAGVTELSTMKELREMRLLMNKTATRAEVLQFVIKYPLEFQPGSMQAYSNTGFWLLGQVVEKASGMKYEEYIQKKIFEPLGMTRSMYCNSAVEVERRASPHMIRGGNTRRVPEIVHTATYSAGAICSTAQDQVTWLQALHGGQALSSKSTAEIMAPAKLNDGTAVRYGMGLYLGDDDNGRHFIGHSGGGFGFSSDTRWYPDAKLAVVMLTNSEPDAISATADELVAAVLPAPRSAGPFKGDAALLAGTYKGPGRGGKEMVIAVTPATEGIAISLDGSPAAATSWIADWKFRSKGLSVLEFRRDGKDKSGPAKELRLDNGGGYFILQRQ